MHSDRQNSATGCIDFHMRDNLHNRFDKNLIIDFHIRYIPVNEEAD